MSQKTSDLPSSASEIATMVRGRTISAVDATKACLERIERLDSKLHAFHVVRAEKALAEAASVDDRRDLSDLPLAGVPVSIKDNFNVAGEPTRVGSRATSDAPAKADDVAVRRLKDAGAVVIGKTTLPEMAIFGFTETAFAITRNPWNPQRSPGGSSGGAGVAVATGMSPLALGSDGLGSIRIPATFCGVFALKPTRGRLPLMGDLAEHWFSLSVSAPTAATVGDAALMIDVLGGTTTFRDVMMPAKKLRIAVSMKPPTFLASLEQPIRDAVNASVATLREAGHSVIESDPPYPLSLPNNVLRLWAAGVGQDVKNLDWTDLEKRTQTMVRLGRLLGPAPPKALDRWASAASSWFRDFDVALMPCVAHASIPAGVWYGRGFVSTVLQQIRALPYTAPWNVAGFPAASVPAGIGPDGVPLSVQVVAPAGGDGLVLSVAAQLEQLRPWPRFSPDAAR